MTGFIDLYANVEKFTNQWCRDKDGEAMKRELLELVQSAIDHGEQKDQNKIVGIATKLFKSIWGK